MEGGSQKSGSGIHLGTHESKKRRSDFWSISVFELAFSEEVLSSGAELGISSCCCRAGQTIMNKKESYFRNTSPGHIG